MKFTRVGIAPVLLVAWLASALPAHGQAAIDITSVPPYAVDGFIAGNVSGVDFNTHEVAVYIQIEGAGWWTKPTFAIPTVPIQGDGSYSADVASGGLDNRATIYCAAVVQSGVSPPAASGAARIPASLSSPAITCVERYSRTFEFAGLLWAVKEAPLPVGPGGNVFSDSPADVFVDALGRLHLTVRFDAGCGCWRSSEVILLDSLGYGTYSVQTESELDDLDANVTFGIFTWDAYGDEETVPGDGHREIDVEYSRWGNAADPSNAQFVVQPFGTPGNLQRFTVPDLSADERLTQFFRWEEGQIRWVALTGHHSSIGFPLEDVIDEYLYVEDAGMSHVVPTEGRERLRLNAWINTGGAPAGGTEVEVIVTSFDFTPLGAVPVPPWAVGALSVLIPAVGRATLRTHVSR